MTGRETSASSYYLTPALCRQLGLHSSPENNQQQCRTVRYIGMVQDISGEVEYVEHNGMYEEQQCMYLKKVLPVDYIRGYREDVDRMIGFEHVPKRVKLEHHTDSCSSNSACDVSKDGEQYETILAVFRGSEAKPHLNDLVEIVGVLEDFTDEVMNVDEGLGNDTFVVRSKSTGDGFVQYPRVIVSSFERLDWDTYKATMSGIRLNSRIFDHGLNDRGVVIEGLAHHLFCGNTLVAEALLVALLSKAERENNNVFGNPIKMDRGGSSTSVGCAALNLIMPNEADCASFGRVLDHALHQLFPCTSSLDLTIENLNGGNLTPPMKSDDYDRMKDSSLQHIKGSILLLNNRTNLSKSNAVNYLNETGESTMRTIATIASTQSVLYSFGPYCQCKFDADYRIISLSTMNSSDLIPCELQMKVNGAFVTRQVDSPIQNTFPPELAEKLRLYFARCQSIQNIIFSSEICERAEQTFIQRRVDARSGNCRKSITEADFHRWLTLTRLQARSRYFGDGSSKCEANIQDWEMALQLDDAMQATFNSVQVSPMRSHK